MLSARTTGCLFLCVVLSASVCLTPAARAAERDVRVLVWDEQQPRQKQAYDNFLGNAIAAYLQTRPGLVVRSTNLNAPQQGLSDKALDACDVLVWWGHVRQSEVSEKTGQAIVQRIKSGRLSLIALHSAHWSTPFVQAMYERTRFNVAARFPAVNGERVEVEYIQPPKRYYAPKQNDLLTPSMYPRKYPDRLTKIQVYLPNCCFPGYRPDGKPSYVKTVLPDHPIAKALGEQRARKLASLYSPAQIRVPLARTIRARHYRANGDSNGEIATKLGMTETGVDKMFDRMDCPPDKGSAQLSLQI